MSRKDPNVSLRPRKSPKIALLAAVATLLLAVAASAQINYVIEDFDDVLTLHDLENDDTGGGMGPITAECLDAQISSLNAQEGQGRSLLLAYDFEQSDCTGGGAGFFLRLFGGPLNDPAYTADFTDYFRPLAEPGGAVGIDAICFSVRRGDAGGPNHLRVELKDYRDSDDFLAEATVPLGGSGWQDLCLDADVSNTTIWSHRAAGQLPAADRMKVVTFLIDKDAATSSGEVYLDRVRLVDLDGKALDQSVDDEAFLDLVERRAVQYFLDNASNRTASRGLIFDRATAPDTISIGATGFGLSVLPVAVERGWISRDAARARAQDTLRTLTSCRQALELPACGYRGFFYHFLDVESGNRAGDSELSNVDSTYLLYGALVVGSYFDDDAKIVSMANELIEGVDWPFFFDDCLQQFHMGWKPVESEEYAIAAPGGGFFSQRARGPLTPQVACLAPGAPIPLTWDTTTDEILLLNLLAVASPSHPVAAESFYAWARPLDQTGSFVVSHDGSLFTYFFATNWLNTWALGRDRHPTTPVDWFENSRAAIARSRACTIARRDTVACDGDTDYVTFGPETWSQSASFGPYDDYKAYGETCVAYSPPESDGTIAPYAAGGSILFLPEEAIASLRHLYFETDVWRHRYGFGDSLNHDVVVGGGCYQDWHNHDYLGIDQGPLALSIENYRSGLLWNILADNRDLRRAFGELFQGCEADSETLCLGSGRFKVTVTWQTGDQTGTGQAVPLTSDSGYFWFFQESNIEVLVKVINGCSINGHFWVFAAGLTNLDVELVVEDTATGATHRYTRTEGPLFAPIGDTGAFATCS